MFDNLTNNNDDIYPIERSPGFVDLRFFLVRIFYPCLLIWGTIGNALCLRVLLSKKFFKNSTCQYLAILAVIDILFIFMRSSKHVYKLFRSQPIFNTSQLVCRILTFSSSALAHMGSWILVIVSFDRYLIVTSRYRRHSSSAHRVFCSTSILIAIVTLCNLYYFFILGRIITPQIPHGLYNQQHDLVNDTTFLNNTLSEDIEYENETETEHKIEPKMISIFMCIPTSAFEQIFRRVIPVFDILLVAVIPFFLLCFTNIGIITYTMRANQRMRQHRKRAHRRHQRLTIMLLSVTLAFIGLTCPSVIFICVNKIIYSAELPGGLGSNSQVGVRSNSPSSNGQLIVDICEALWYTKHAMNFILYTLSGQDFRREFIKLFPSCFHNRPSILKKLVNRTQTSTDHTLDSSSIEMPIVTSTIRKKSKKQNNNNKGDRSTMSFSSKTTTTTTTVTILPT
ncbi:unnamed protein product [Adineta steineri]|uniref:G-protein coupled receptors family 1 profile domain-containing protein n=1 Tax=Adineta steineri TaxID=433720 RepID=A0A818IWA3_9BILA|nr:unnamed protein product [Adineta steineri]CAF3528352.1 unnamed protein product [Adineta steineri]